MKYSAGKCALCNCVFWEAFKPDEVWVTHPHTRECLLSGVSGPVRMFQAKAYEGMKLVPLIPTDSMIEEGKKAAALGRIDIYTRSVYMAMVEEAP